MHLKIYTNKKYTSLKNLKTRNGNQITQMEKGKF